MYSSFDDFFLYHLLATLSGADYVASTSWVNNIFNTQSPTNGSGYNSNQPDDRYRLNQPGYNSNQRDDGYMTVGHMLFPTAAIKNSAISDPLRLRDDRRRI
jgi:hypothetical protein